MRFKQKLITCASAGITAALALSIPGPAMAQNFIVNGGFEDGDVAGVPNGWTPNAAYLTGGYRGVSSANPVHSGSYSLEIGDYDNSPVETLSQTFADVIGSTYTATFWGLAGGTGDSNAYLKVSAGGNSLTFCDSASYCSYDAYDGDTSSTNNYFLKGVFTFVGTGSDTLTIAAKTNPNDWYVDDVSVTGPAVSTMPVSGVPEPASWAMMIVGFGLVGAGLRQRRKMPVVRYV